MLDIRSAGQSLVVKPTDGVPCISGDFLNKDEATAMALTLLDSVYDLLAYAGYQNVAVSLPLDLETLKETEQHFYDEV